MAGSDQNVYQNVASGMTSAGQGLMDSMNYQPMQVTPQNRDIQKYLNPYTQSVIDGTMKTLGDANLIAKQQLSDRADSQGAFGGSRLGVQEGIADAKFGELATNFANKMNEANYNQALKNATFDVNAQLKSDLANQTAGLNQNRLATQSAIGLGQLANLGFTQGQTLQNQQAREGALIQALNQAILDGENAQIEGFLGSGNEALSTLLSAIVPLTASAPSTQTTTKKTGLIDIITSIAEAYARS